MAITLEEWERRTLRILRTTAPKEYTKIARRAGNLLRRKVRKITPKVSGALRRSYRVKVKDGLINEKLAITYTKKFYANMVEEGHVIRRKRKGRILGFVPGKHYLRRALEETKQELPDLLRGFLRQVGRDMGFV